MGLINFVRNARFNRQLGKLVEAGVKIDVAKEVGISEMKDIGEVSEEYRNELSAIQEKLRKFEIEISELQSEYNTNLSNVERLSASAKDKEDKATLGLAGAYINKGYRAQKKQISNYGKINKGLRKEIKRKYKELSYVKKEEKAAKRALKAFEKAVIKLGKKKKYEVKFIKYCQKHSDKLMQNCTQKEIEEIAKCIESMQYNKEMIGHRRTTRTETKKIFKLIKQKAKGKDIDEFISPYEPVNDSERIRVEQTEKNDSEEKQNENENQQQQAQDQDKEKNDNTPEDREDDNNQENEDNEKDKKDEKNQENQEQQNNIKEQITDMENKIEELKEQEKNEKDPMKRAAIKGALDIYRKKLEELQKQEQEKEQEQEQKQNKPKNQKNKKRKNTKNKTNKDKSTKDKEKDKKEDETKENEEVNNEDKEKEEPESNFKDDLKQGATFCGQTEIKRSILEQIHFKQNISPEDFVYIVGARGIAGMEDKAISEAIKHKDENLSTKTLYYALQQEGMKTILAMKKKVESGEIDPNSAESLEQLAENEKWAAVLVNNYLKKEKEMEATKNQKARSSEIEAEANEK